MTFNETCLRQNARIATAADCTCIQEIIYPGNYRRDAAMEEATKNLRLISHLHKAWLSNVNPGEQRLSPGTGSQAKQICCDGNSSLHISPPYDTQLKTGL